MKKLIISVGVLLTMSFTGNKIYQSYKLAEAVNMIQDVKEWMAEDVFNGIIDEEVAKDYLHNFNEIEKHIIEYSEENRIVTNKYRDYLTDSMEIEFTPEYIMQKERYLNEKIEKYTN